LNSNATVDSATTPILEMDKVRFDRRDETSIRMDQFSGRIESGQLTKVTLQRRHDPRDVVSLMLGLHQPQSGSIRYDAQDWLGTDYSRHFRMRSQIGRVFAGSAWIQSLTVRDNIQLSMSHQRVSKSEIKSNINRWTKRLSGKRIASVHHAMKRRPAFVEPSVLQVCQFVRAFCNRPRLLILERPLRSLAEDFYADFMSSIQVLLSRGTAILWFAGDRQEYQVNFQAPTTQWKIENDFLTVAEGSNS
jgi:ABC-type ATPase involved in cell division